MDDSSTPTAEGRLSGSKTALAFLNRYSFGCPDYLAGGRLHQFCGSDRDAAGVTSH